MNIIKKPMWHLSVMAANGAQWRQLAIIGGGYAGVWRLMSARMKSSKAMAAGAQ
jgi:hypothetical protein